MAQGSRLREWPNGLFTPMNEQQCRMSSHMHNSLWRKSRIRPGPGAVEFRTLSGMAMGKRPAARQGSPLWVTTADLPTNAGHPFFERLNRVLEEVGFDAFVEGLCAGFYAARMGRPSLRPGRYFRMLFIGYFEGLTPLYVKNAWGHYGRLRSRGLDACGECSWRTPRVSGAPETGMGELRPL